MAINVPEQFNVLPKSFFEKDALLVARELVGRYLMVNTPKDGVLPFKIIETEAYKQDDPACHAYQKATGRAANLYRPPGLAYVYLIYGMYYCLNVVCEPEGTGAAVLFRALQPPNNFHSYQTNGPGRLCKALGITTAQHNGVDMNRVTSPLYLASDRLEPRISETSILATTRIGITKGIESPWRFYEVGNPWVSVRNKVAEANLLK